jgi:ribosomal protein S18 acetylase RimI-like enzyme
MSGAINMPDVLRFREIDVDADAEICIQFRADSFVESFGSAERFFRAAGDGGRDYLDGLKAKNLDWPGSCVHARLDGTIVGQIELRRERGDASHAHVLLYYLRPDCRGRDLGSQLDAYVLELCRAAGVQTTTLRVSPTNARAIGYYRKYGWRERGRDPEHPDVDLMERQVAAI